MPQHTSAATSISAPASRTVYSSLLGVSVSKKTGSFLDVPICVCVDMDGLIMDQQVSLLVVGQDVFKSKAKVGSVTSAHGYPVRYKQPFQVVFRAGEGKQPYIQ
uniref:Uncharacterized protein n=1 Tax=Zea mays TaxID=4577 RepID=A0A804MGR2_MAIZE